MNSVLGETSGAAIELIAPELVKIGRAGDVRLRIGRCRHCSALSFPAAPVCASCLSQDMDGETVEGSGELYAYSIVHQAPRGWNVPYALGYVDLPNGLRVLGHIQVEFARLRSGLPVELALGAVRTAPDGNPVHSYVFKSTK